MFGLSWQNSLVLVVTCCCCIAPVTTLLLLMRFRAVGIVLPALGVFSGLVMNLGGVIFGRGNDDEGVIEEAYRREGAGQQSLAQIRAQTDSSFGAQLGAQGAPPPGGQYGAQGAPQGQPGRDPFMPDASQFQPRNAAYNPNAPNQAFQGPPIQGQQPRGPYPQQGYNPPQGQQQGRDPFMPDASQWQGGQNPQGYPPQGPPQGGQPPNPQGMYPVRPGGEYGYRIEPGAPGPRYSPQRGGVPPQGQNPQQPQQGQRPPQGYPQQPQQGQRPPQGYPQQPQQGQQPPRGNPPNPAQQGWQGGFPNPNISLDTAPGQPPQGAPGFSDDDYYGDAGIPGLRNSPHPPRRDNRGREWREGEIFGGMLDDDGDGHPDF